MFIHMHLQTYTQNQNPTKCLCEIRILMKTFMNQNCLALLQMKENDIASLGFLFPFLLPEQQSIQTEFQNNIINTTSLSEFQNEGNNEFQQHKFEIRI